MSEKEYIVTVKKDVDWQTVHQDIINDTTTDDSVDSNIIPDRACECCKERPLNNRNTHYHLTDAEAAKLRNDPRIIAVQDINDIPEPTPVAFQSGNFDKTSTQFGTQSNWGLIRHTSETQVYGSSLSDQGLTYDYVLDGTGVDMVIVDTGIQTGHPEWQDADGNSRLQQIDWYAESGVSGTQPANFYTDTNGHGTHCIGTMAGKNFGWAKNARIYNITLYSNSGNTISWDDTIDCLIGWHNNKPIDPATGVKRPTVVNMSFQYGWYINTSPSPNEIILSSTGYSITGGSYRGVAHSETQRSSMSQYGVTGSFRGNSLYLFGRKFASIDADVEQLINNGIHVCTAAGNDYIKIDVPGGVDYNNYLTFQAGGINYYMYYHRGPSPSTFEGGDTFQSTNTGTTTGDINEGFDVGAVDNTTAFDGGQYKDRKVNFSNSGPGVGIYAVGDNVISSVPNNQGSTYYLDANWRQAKFSGTSMASPQMCGMIGLLLQAHPDWTPGQAKQYFINNSLDVMYNTGNTDDYSTTTTLHGGNNRLAYFPLKGQRPFSIG